MLNKIPVPKPQDADTHVSESVSVSALAGDSDPAAAAYCVCIVCVAARHFKYQIYFDSISVKARKLHLPQSACGRLPGTGLGLKLTLSYGRLWSGLVGPLLRNLHLNDF